MEYGNGDINHLVWKSSNNRYHNQDFEVDENNLNVNVAILSKYVQNGDRVLDIGCGEGKFGCLLKNKDCTLLGVDIDIESAQYAKKYNGYSEVLCANIESDEFPIKYTELKTGGFDVVALIDVLEHVINPTKVIENAVKVLKDTGIILISIPNINNADIFANLLKDQFNYREAGVLDNTHTKYFTKTSFVSWIQEINQEFSWSLDCEYIGSIYGYTEYMEKMQEERPFLYRFLQLNPYFHVSQHMFVLTYYNDNHSTIKLDKLREEKFNDLTSVLDDLIAKSSEKEQLNEVKVLDNERKIMEERYDVAQKGWEDCRDALVEAKKNLDIKNEFINTKEYEIGEIKELLREKDKALISKDDYIIKMEKDIAEIINALAVEQKNNENLINRIEVLSGMVEALGQQFKEIEDRKWFNVIKKIKGEKK